MKTSTRLFIFIATIFFFTPFSLGQIMITDENELTCKKDGGIDLPNCDAYWVIDYPIAMCSSIKSYSSYTQGDLEVPFKSGVNVAGTYNFDDIEYGPTGTVYYSAGTTQYRYINLYQLDDETGKRCLGTCVIYTSSQKDSTHQYVNTCQTIRDGSYTYTDPKKSYTFTKDTTITFKHMNKAGCDSMATWIFHFRDTSRCTANYEPRKVCDSIHWSLQRGKTNGLGDTTIVVSKKRLAFDVPYKNQLLELTYKQTPSTACIIRYGEEPESEIQCDSIARLKYDIYTGKKKDSINATYCVGYNWLKGMSWSNTTPGEIPVPTGKTKPGDSYQTHKESPIGSEGIYINMADLYKDSVCRAIISNSNNSCPDTMILHLKKDDPTESTVVEYFCNKASHDWEGVVDDKCPAGPTPKGTVKFNTPFYRNGKNISYFGYNPSGGAFTPLSVTIHNTKGCDSIVHYKLALANNDTVDIPENVSSCQSRSDYPWKGKTYHNDMTENNGFHLYSDTITGKGHVIFTDGNGNSRQCDSIYLLALQVYEDIDSILTVTNCDEYIWTTNHTTYKSSTNEEYKSTLAVHYLCDSIYRLNLTINRRDTTPKPLWKHIDTCTTFEWYGSQYPTNSIIDSRWAEQTIPDGKTDTFYYHVTQNQYGCDSIDVLVLTVKDTVKVTKIATCDSLLWHGNWYKESNTQYTSRLDRLDNLPKYKSGNKVPGTNCDSVELLSLKVLPSYTGNRTDTLRITKTNGDDSLFCDSLIWSHHFGHGTSTIYTTFHYGVNYSRDTLIDSVYTTASTAQHLDLEYPLPAEGCDSVTYLDLQLNRTLCQSSHFEDTIPGSGGTMKTTIVCDSVVLGARGGVRYRLPNGIWRDLHGDTVIKSTTAYETHGFAGIEVYDTIKNGNKKGCDSIRHIVYNVHLNYRDTVYPAPVCSPYKFTNDGSKIIVRDTAFDTIVILGTPTKIPPENICDTIHYEHLTIKPSFEIAPKIYACDSLIWGQNLRNAKTHQPLTNDSVFRADVDAQDSTICDSLKTQYNCDSVIYLNLTITQHTELGTIDAAGCDFYWWNDLPSGDPNRKYTAQRQACYDTNIYDTIKYLSPNSTRPNSSPALCDQITTLHLTFYPFITDTIKDTVCNGFRYESMTEFVTHDSTYIETNSHWAEAQSVYGINCPVNKAFKVKVNQPHHGCIDTAVCDSITYHGFTVGHANYGSVGTVNEIVDGTDENGCPTRDTIKVEIHPNKYKYIEITACDDTLWKFKTINHTYKKDTVDIIRSEKILPQWTYNYSKGGSFSDKCDSIYEITVTINKSTIYDSTAHACNSYYWSLTGLTYNTENYDNATKRWIHDGDKYDTIAVKHAFKNAKNCDTTTRLLLTLDTTKYYIEHVITNTSNPICDSFDWKGSRFWGDTNMALNPNHEGYVAIPGGSLITGCDSLVGLHLDLDSTKYRYYGTVHACYEYIWEPISRYEFEKSGSIIEGKITSTVPDTIRFSKKEGRQSYDHTTGCDSVHIINVVLHGNQQVIVDTTFCDSLIWNGRTYRQSYVVDNDSLLYPTKSVIYTECDSIVKLIPHVKYSTKKTDYTLPVPGCTSSINFKYYDGLTKYFDTTYIADNGTTQLDTLIRPNVVGCDSTIYLTVHLSPMLYSVTPIEVKECDSLTIGTSGGARYYNSSAWVPTNGRFTIKSDLSSLHPLGIEVYDTLLGKATNGCDSIAHMRVWIEDNINDTIDTVTECASFSAYLRDTIIQAGSPSSIDGSFCHTINWRKHVVLPTYKIDSTVYACDSMVWTSNSSYLYNASTHEKIWNKVLKSSINLSAGDSICDSLKTIKACDSVIFINLEITSHTKDTLDTVYGCDNYSWVRPSTGIGQDYNPPAGRQGKYDTIVRDTIFSTSPTSIRTLATKEQCDIVHYLPIRFFATKNSTKTIIECDSTTLDFGPLDKTVIRSSTVVPHTSYQAWGKAVGLNCDSIDTYVVTINNSNPRTLDTIVCDSITFHGNHYGYANIGTDTLIQDTVPGFDESGCETRDTIKVTIKPNGYKELYTNVCDTFVWFFKGKNQNYTNSIVATHTTHNGVEFVDKKGFTRNCDSIYINHITIRHRSEHFDTIEACNQHRWTINGQTYTPDNYNSTTHKLISTSEYVQYNHTTENAIKNQSDCDSISILILTLKESPKGFETRPLPGEHICDSLLWNGKWYKEPIDMTGHVDLYATIPDGAANGCDSLVGLNLTHLDTTTRRISDPVTACDFYYWPTLHKYNTEAGISSDPTAAYIYSSGTKIVQFSKDGILHSYDPATGCDSVITISVTIKPKQDDKVILHSACDSFEWHGNMLKRSYSPGDPAFSHVDPDVNGCDSTTILNLTIHYSDAPQDKDFYGCTYVEKHYTHSNGSQYKDTSYVSANGLIQKDTITLQNRWQCDSTLRVTVHLTYLDTIIPVWACDSIVLGSRGGVAYKDPSGTFHFNHGPKTFYSTKNYLPDSIMEAFDTIKSNDPQNCDTVRHLKVKVYENVIENVYISQCGFYDDGIRFTRDTTYSSGVPRPIQGGHCDTIKKINLTIYPTYEIKNQPTLYACDSLVWGSKLYYAENQKRTSNVFTSNVSELDNVRDSLKTKQHSCDSVVYLKLQIAYHTTSDAIYRTECGETYTWNDAPSSISHTYSVPTGYQGKITTTLRDTLKYFPDTSIRSYATRNQCDLITPLELTLYAKKRVDLPEKYYCDSVEMMPSMGFIKKDSLYVETKSQYEPWALYSKRCDSITIHHIKIDTTVNVVIDTAACDSITFYGQLFGYARYPQNDTIDRILDTVDIHNCSIKATIRVAIHPNIHIDTAAEACDSWWWWRNDQPYTQSLIDTIQHLRVAWTYNHAMNGRHTTLHCDSLYINNITINHPSIFDSVVYACDSFYWHHTDITYLMADYDDATKQWTNDGGISYDTIKYKHRLDGVYDRNGCDSITNLIINFRETKYGIVLWTNTPAYRICDSFQWPKDMNWYYNDTNMALNANHKGYILVRGGNDYFAGCDSLVGLHLDMDTTIVRDYGTHHICYGQTYYWESYRNYLAESPRGSRPGDGEINHSLSTSIKFSKDNGSNYYDLTTGCDSILSINIVMHRAYDTTVTIDACDSILWDNGRVYRTPYDRPADSLVATFHTVQYNCDSTVTLHPIIRPSSPINTPDTHIACSFTVYKGVPYSSANGLLQHDTTRALNRFGCDSLSPIVIVLGDEQSDSVWLHPTDKNWYCDSMIWTPSQQPGHSYVIRNYVDSVYRDTVFGAAPGSCDSIHIAKIEVRPSAIGHDEPRIGCDSVRYGAKWYSSDTNLIIPSVYGSANGCDSVTEIPLRLRPSTAVATTISVCDSFRWSNDHGRWSGDINPSWDTVIRHSHSQPYQIENVVALHPYINAQGCNTVDTLYLSLSPSDTTTTFDTFCYRYTWRLSNTEGIYFSKTWIATTDSIVDTTVQATNNNFNCKHYDQLNLTILKNDTIVVHDTACGSYTWNTTNYTSDISGESTKYKPGTTNRFGCDSIFYLDLKIHNTVYGDTSAESCGDFVWHINGKYKQRTGDYRICHDDGLYKDTIRSITSALKCDSVVTLTFTYKELRTGKDSTIWKCEGSPAFPWAESRPEPFPEPITHDDTTYIIIIEPKTSQKCDSVNILHYNILRKKYNPDTLVIDTCNFSGLDADYYVWEGETRRASGIYSKTYHPSFKGELCDSTVFLKLSYGSTEWNRYEESVCDSFRWALHPMHFVDSSNKRSDTVIYDTTWRRGNCPIIDSLVLHRKFTNYEIIEVKACNVYSWTPFNDSTPINYTYSHRPSVESTKQISHRNYANGCDSVRWLKLDMGSSQQITDNRGTECDSIRWRDGNLYTNTVSGTSYYNSPFNEFGCDTTYRLYVVINQSDTLTLPYQTVCDSLIWTINTSDTIYYDTFRVGDASQHIRWTGYTENGCKLYSKRQLNVVESVRDTTKVPHARLSYTWDVDGNTYIESDTVKIGTTSLNSFGLCDSFYVLALHVDGYSMSINDIDVCDTFRHVSTYSGFKHVYTTSGTYAVDTVARPGQIVKDSIVAYNVTIHTKDSVTVLDSMVCGSSYTWDEVPIFRDSSFAMNAGVPDINIHGCDSINFIHFSLVSKRVNNIEVPLLCDDSIRFDFYEFHKTYYTTVDHDTVGTKSFIDRCDSTLVISILNIGHKSMYDSVFTGCKTRQSNYTSMPWNGNDYAFTTYDTIPAGNNVDGCDSSVRVHIVVNDTTHGIDAHEQCTAVSTFYRWINGNNYSAAIPAGSPSAPSVRMTNSNGCDSIVYLQLTFNEPKYRDTTATACDTFHWVAANNRLYSTSGVYTYVVVNPDPKKCDSTVTLTLTVNKSTHNTFNVTSCFEYDWTSPYYNKLHINESNTYHEDYVNAAGCESTDTLHLTILGINIRTLDTINACDSFLWHGSYITFDSVDRYGEEHIYTRLIPADGLDCEHTDSLYLILNNSIATIDSIEICARDFTWHGNRYTSSYNASDPSAPTETLTRSNGCDSVVTLNLVLNKENKYRYLDTTVCDTLRWSNGITYRNNTARPWPTDTVHSDGKKCDSITFLRLTVKRSTHNVEEYTKCDSYVWHGKRHEIAGYVTDTFGYYNGVGCFSVDTLKLVVINGRDTEYYDTACDYYRWATTGRRFSADSIDGIQRTYTEPVSSTDLACSHYETLHLVLYKNKGQMEEATECKVKDWNPHGTGYQYLTSSGDYYVSYLDEHKCRAIDTLRLKILNTSDTFHIHACDSFTWSRTINGNQKYSVNYFIMNYRDVMVTPNYDVRNYTIQDGSKICTMSDTLYLTMGARSLNETATIDSGCEEYRWISADQQYVGRYTTTGFYTGTIKNPSGCDSTIHLNLTIHRRLDTSYAVEACDSYVIGNVTYTTTATIPYTYNDQHNCVSKETIHLTIKNSYHKDTTVNACDTFYWDFKQETYRASQSVIHTIVRSNGCDSTVNLNLTVNYNTSHSETNNVCDSYTWHGNTYTDSGTYYYNYTTPAGCVSQDTLNLTVRHSSNTRFDTTSCDSLEWRVDETYRATYKTSGVYTYNYPSAEGCASVDTLYLSVNYSKNSIDNRVVCDSLLWIDGNTYHANTSMMNYHTDSTALGCDSIIWLVLTVNSSSVSTDTLYDYACNKFNWAVDTGHMNNGSFERTGIYMVNGIKTPGIHKAYFCKNSVGCDSLAVLNLTIRYSDTSDAYAERCLEFYDNNYSNRPYRNDTQHDTTFILYRPVEFRYYDKLCDSTIRLHLTLHPVKNNPIEYATACDAYTWNGSTYTTSGAYSYHGTTIYGCDSIVNLSLVINRADSSRVDSAVVCDSMRWHQNTYKSSGIYRDTTATHEGCDSIQILYLTVHHRVHNRIDTTVCDFIYWPNDRTYDTISTSTYGVVTHTTYPYLYGCEQVDTLYLTVNNSTIIEFDSSVCDSVKWYSPTNRQGEWYKTSGDIRHTLLEKNSQNCDIILRMHLTVHPSLLRVESLASCDSVMWHGAWLTTSQNVGLTYDSTYSDGRQCRVTDSLYFTRNGNNVYRQNESKFACDTFTWSRNGITYTQSDTYYDTIRNAAGCDSSIATLVLTIANGVYDTLDTVSCLAPVPWNDSTYAEQGIYMISGETTQGCPLIKVLMLHTGHYDTLTTKSVCERYTWNGIEYSHEGYSLVADTNTTAFGCDSNTYLPLTIIKSQRTRTDTALLGQEFYWALHDKTYTLSGTFIDTIDYSLSMNCGRIDTLVLQLTNVPLPQILANTAHTIIMFNHYPDGEDGDRVDFEVYRWYMDGVLQNGMTTDVFNNRDWSSLNGHYYYLEVLYNNMWLRSNTVDLRTTTGIDEATETIDFAIYPNPVISGRTLTMTLQGDNLDLHGATLTVFDLHGRDLLCTSVNSERTTLSANLPAGVYNLRLTLSDGRTAVKKLIVR